MLSADDRRAIAVRASGVYERARRLTVTSGIPPTSESDANALLTAWLQAFAPGNPEALVRRLAWDGLTPDLVRAAASTAIDRSDPPAWTGWLERFSDTGSPGDDVGGESVPFVEIWMPIVRAARQALAVTVALHPVAPGPQADLERQLLRELSTCGELALDELFAAHLRARGVDRAHCSPESTVHYRAFVDHLLAGGLQEIWRAYPVLARQAAIVAEGWVASTTELLTRLAADRPLIAETLNGGIDPGPIARIDAGLSDPHEGRRRVAVVHFASGLRVVYKPRDLGVDRAFARLCGWLASRGLEPALPALRVVTGEGYGWLEFAEPHTFENAGAVRRYFRQAGALMAVTHLLGSRDLHMENVVATAAGPVLIDLELLLQPHRQAGDVDAEQSCLRSGFLSYIEFDARDTPFDVGGLRGSGTMPLAISRREWRHLRSDAVAFVDQATVSAVVQNGVRLDGQLLSPDAFAAEMLDGFTHAYDVARTHRDELLAADGPVAAFGGVELRIIVRPTNQYALLSVVRNTPRYQRDGAVRSVVVDALYRTLSGAPERPREWPIVVEERRALEALDVPRFVVAGGERSVRADGRTLLDDYYARSPVDGVADRLRGLSADDFDHQRRRLSLALRDSTGSRFASPPPADAHDFFAHAEWIGRELLNRAVHAGGGLIWTDAPLDRGETHYLYDGAVGAALFYAALARATNDAQWTRTATAAIKPTLDWIDAPGSSVPAAIGGCSGLGSIVYGVASVGSLLRDERILAAAGRVARRIDRDRIRADERFDVVEGAAGAILALLALHARTGDAAVLDIARSCGDHLMASRNVEPDGWSWTSADGRRFLGFAHGAAGIGDALIRLAGATGRQEYRDGATAVFAFVSRFFSPADANWPAAAPDSSDISTAILRMTTWCHGAPGIALAAADAVRVGVAPEPVLVAQAAAGLGRVPAWIAHHADHLCCGHLGRADALLIAGERLQLPDAATAAREMGRRVLARARRHQHFRLSTAGVEYRVFDPGFFRGLSGIGYQLLRLERPDEILSVLDFA